MSYKLPSVFALLSFLLIGSFVSAQPKDNSPFSRYGLGNYNPNYFTALAGMGGIGTAFQDAYHLNMMNPASLASLKETSFEVGIFARYASLKSNETPTSVWSGNLNYLAIGFPMHSPINEVLDRKKREIRWGMGFSLAPYTLVGYDVSTESPHPTIDTVTVLTDYQGTGGTYKIMWGNAIQYKHLSAGINLGYLFGKISNNRHVYFNNYGVNYEDYFVDDISNHGFVWNLGLQYEISLDSKQKKKDDEADLETKRGKRLIFGLQGNSATGFNTNTSSLLRRVNTSYVLGSSVAIDTIVNISNLRNKGTLPAEFSLGVMYEKINRIKLGLDFGIAQWSQYKNEAKPDSLKNTWQIGFGGEYTPDALSYNEYFSRVRYRIGAYYGLDPRSIRNEQIKKYAVTIGFGFPVVLPRQQISFVDLGLEYGRIGISDIRENYFRISLGFTLNDNSWFYKRKFE